MVQNITLNNIANSNGAKNILLVTETGQGKGHAEQILMLASHLSTNGHNVTIASSCYANKKDLLREKGIRLLDQPETGYNTTSLHDLDENVQKIRLQKLINLTSKQHFDFIGIERGIEILEFNRNETIPFLKHLKDLPDAKATSVVAILPDFIGQDKYSYPNIYHNRDSFTERTKANSFLQKLYGFAKSVGGEFVKDTKDFLVNRMKKVEGSGEPETKVHYYTNYFQHIIKMGDQNLAPLGEKSDWMTSLQENNKVIEIGYPIPKVALEKSIGKGTGITVAIGGGNFEEGNILIEKMLHSYKYLPSELKEKPLNIFVPPESKMYNYAKQFISENPDIKGRMKVHEFSSQFRTSLKNSSLLVSLGGYTVTEAAAYNTPTLAFTNGQSEQISRVEAFEKLGFCSNMAKFDIKNISPQDLAKVLTDEYKSLKEKKIDPEVTNSSLFKGLDNFLNLVGGKVRLFKDQIKEPTIGTPFTHDAPNNKVTNLRVPHHLYSSQTKLHA